MEKFNGAGRIKPFIEDIYTNTAYISVQNHIIAIAYIYVSQNSSS
jgi:hypothetical protein